MGRVKEELLYADLEAEEAAWNATPEGQAWLRKQEQERREEERRQLQQEQHQREQERDWARDHASEWAAWLNLQPDWNHFHNFGDEKEYGFEEFLQEVAPAPSKQHIISKKDKKLPFQPGNLEWRLTPIVVSPFLTTEEAAAFLRTTPDTIYDWVKRGLLVSDSTSRRLLFMRETLERFAKTRRRAKANSTSWR